MTVVASRFPLRGTQKNIVSVADTGIGMSAEEQPHIFERFYASSDGRNTYGSGLGLPIAKEITELLGEKIWVTSALRKGTSVFFTVDAAK